MIYTPIFEYLMPKIIFRSPHQRDNKVYLTFDDGPDPHSTNKIAAILSDYNIKASFFAVGSQIKKYPDIVKHLNEEGHLVCNHSYSHYNSFYIAKTKLEDEIFATQQLLDKYCSRIGNYFLPPQHYNS